MEAARTPGAVSDPQQALDTFRAEGCSEPRTWANGPGERYGWHAHRYHKVLFCLEGSIRFHLRDGDVCLTAGDRLDLPAGVEHAATVGPEGVRCIEASR
jgi:mannose-6-phosphate isomerase-like protein (cupin superfamily)